MKAALSMPDPLAVKVIARAPATCSAVDRRRRERNHAAGAARQHQAHHGAHQGVPQHRSKPSRLPSPPSPLLLLRRRRPRSAPIGAREGCTVCRAPATSKPASSQPALLRTRSLNRTSNATAANGREVHVVGLPRSVVLLVPVRRLRRVRVGHLQPRGLGHAAGRPRVGAGKTMRDGEGEGERDRGSNECVALLGWGG